MFSGTPGGARGTRGDARDGTWVRRVQGECSARRAIAPAPVAFLSNRMVRCGLLLKWSSDCASKKSYLRKPHWIRKKERKEKLRTLLDSEIPDVLS